MTISRRRLLNGFLAASGISILGNGCSSSTASTASALAGPPGPAPAGPAGEVDWQALRDQVGDRLIQVRSPLAACQTGGGGADCSVVLRNLQNPFFCEDEPGATQTTGWLDAWTPAVGPWAVAAERPGDVAAAVSFARDRRLRLSVKGTGHDYLGRSNAPDSLLVWTHRMRRVTVHDAFRTEGGPAAGPGVPAISAEAGARWLEVYSAAAAAGRYVQGGGCTSVGAAGGFLQGSGFGSFSKRYGTGAGGVLEMEVVTADGRVVVASEARNPDLFWALRGGGGGTFGIVTRVTLRTHPMPRTVGSLLGRIGARTDEAFRELVVRLLRFAGTSLCNERWGEKFVVNGDRSVDLAMTFLDLDREEARAVWKPLVEWIASRPDALTHDLAFRAIPFRHLWDPEFWKANDPGNIVVDPRPGQPPGQFWWASNQGEVSAFIRSYRSRWLPISMLDEASAPRFAETLIAAARSWRVTLQFNKGLAGAPAEAIARDRGTCLNPAAFDAACLMILVSSVNGAHPGVPGHEPDLPEARTVADRIGRAMQLLRDATPGSGGYANEADFFEPDWQRSFWGENYPRLLAVKRKVDPGNLFRVHHGVGSEG